jgi:hypothetical protein
MKTLESSSAPPENTNPEATTNSTTNNQSNDQNDEKSQQQSGNKRVTFRQESCEVDENMLTTITSQHQNSHSSKKTYDDDYDYEVRP